MKVPMFKSPGPHHGPPGLTYDCTGVDPEQVEDYLENGWCHCYYEALGIPSPWDSEQEETDEPSEYRAELLTMARELGMKPRKSWSDDELKQRIEEKLEGKA